MEWGNYWAKAIRLRDYKHTEAFAGMFSQIGELYNVKVQIPKTLSSINILLNINLCSLSAYLVLQKPRRETTGPRGGLATSAGTVAGRHSNLLATEG